LHAREVNRARATQAFVLPVHTRDTSRRRETQAAGTNTREQGRGGERSFETVVSIRVELFEQAHNSAAEEVAWEPAQTIEAYGETVALPDEPRPRQLAADADAAAQPATSQPSAKQAFATAASERAAAAYAAQGRMGGYASADRSRRLVDVRA
jgi:hypothetical protein